LVSITFKIGISLTTGAEMVVINSKMAAAKRRKVPTWWKIPVLAIATDYASKRVELGEEEVLLMERG